MHLYDLCFFTCWMKQAFIFPEKNPTFKKFEIFGIWTRSADFEFFKSHEVTTTDDDDEFQIFLKFEL